MNKKMSMDIHKIRLNNYNYTQNNHYKNSFIIV